MLWKSRGFTAAAIVCLALGIGATTVVFSAVNAMLYRPLPFADPERVVAIEDKNERQGVRGTNVAFPNFVDWREQNTVFEGIAVYRNSDDVALTGGGSEPERVNGQTVSANTFDIIGVRPLLGRSFLPGEDSPEAPRTVILSHALWQRRFNARADVIGQTVMLNGYEYSIVGVMPPGFKFPQISELWIPITLRATDVPRGSHNYDCIARLRPGITLEQANAEMNLISRRLEEQYPAANTGWTAVVMPFREARVGEFRPVLHIMLGAVAFVLLIACGNVANLLLARGARRQREIAIRTALGASRWRVMRQLLTESVMLALAGGALGLLFALWGIDAVTSAIPYELPYWMQYTIDNRVLAFTLAISVVTGILFGLAPALQALKPDLNETLKEGGRSSSASLRRNRGRSALVVAEIALSLMLLIGAALMIQSFVRITRVDPGVNTENVLTLRLNLPATRYSEERQAVEFYRALVERVENLPGARAAAATTIVPLTDSRRGYAFMPEGMNSAPDAFPYAQYREITPGYFRTMDVNVLRGRAFTDEDRSDSAPVVIISEDLANRFFGGEAAIGKRLTFGGAQTPLWTIVGIVPETRGRTLDERPGYIYVPHAQAGRRQMTIVMRTESDATLFAPAVRGAIREMDAELPVYDVFTMEEIMARSLWQPRLFGGMFGVFALVALLLASIGLYGLIAYSVSQRTHEFGVRMALGAQTGDVLRLVIKQGLVLIIAGVGLGLAGALLLSRVLSNLLYGVTATDPVTFIGIATLLALIALVASYIPARRATKVDPMVALRYE
jgi:putative ABC transport system permease protein